MSYKPTLHIRFTIKRERVSAPKHSGKSLVKQEFANDADINKLLKRFTPEDLAAQSAAAMAAAQFTDCTKISSLHDAFEFTQASMDAFNKLPADLRMRFNNSPADLARFYKNPSNEDEARELGLLPPKTPAPSKPDANPSKPDDSAKS